MCKRTKLATFILLITLIVTSCSSKNGSASDRAPINNIKDAKAYISGYFNKPVETLWLSDQLSDESGMNMAIITDQILGLNYIPDGYEQKDGYRIYKYKKEEK